MGSCFVGGGAGAGREVAVTVAVAVLLGTGGIDSSGVRTGASFDFVRWKENCDTEAAVPAFMAVKDGTRRPRGRFSESKIAILRQRLVRKNSVSSDRRWVSYGVEGIVLVPW